MQMPGNLPSARRRARRARPRRSAPDPAGAGPGQPDYRVEALASGLRVLSVLSERRPSWRITDITAESFASSAGPNAKTSLDELRPELERIRAQGWAMQDEELAYGFRSVAAPVRGESGAVLAGANLALQSRDWPVQRIVRELAPRLLQTCAEISRLLGHRG